MFKAERPFLLPLPAHRFYPTAPSSLPQFALYLADSKERGAVSHGHRTELPEPFLRFLDSTLWRLQPLIVAMMVGFWLTGLTGIVRSRLAKRKGVPVEFFVGATGFIALAVAELVSVTLIEQAALREIHPILSAPIKSVTIDGEPVGQRDRLVDALRRMHGTIGHHSHPTRSFRVLIKTMAREVRLDLARDSDDPHEYWVFYPIFYATSSNAVGHAFTDALDSR